MQNNQNKSKPKSRHMREAEIRIERANREIERLKLEHAQNVRKWLDELASLRLGDEPGENHAD
jgi:hypothetical protein